MTVRLIRLWSGLVIAVFLVLHLSNHAVGLISLEAAEAARRALGVVYRNPLGQVLLYGSLVLHFGVVVWSLYRRSHLRMPTWELVQILLGLSVPVLLMGHVVGTRGFALLAGAEASYQGVIASIWTGGWDRVLKQLVLVFVVWGHAVVGLHFWLRLKEGYARALPVLYPLAVLLPVLAALGFLRSGTEVLERARSVGWLDGVFAARRALPAETVDWVRSMEGRVLAGFAAVLFAALLARLARRAWRYRYGTFQVEYGADQVVRGHVGETILEISRANGILHASVCGGRGRCTTCRVLVRGGAEHLAPPRRMEREALERIEADPHVRLACQVRPRHDLSITRLLPPTATAGDGRLRGGLDGQEQQVVAMFVDLRGSTTLQELKLPYDVVFILNQFFAEMAEALRVTGGHYAQFSGDGLLALYGLDSSIEQGCRDALLGAQEMQRRLQALNGFLAAELPEPLRIGIGLHSGGAIVGVMGPPASPIRSAIGDTINTAARLEGLTKTFDCAIVISQETARLAGLDLSAYPSHTAEVRGREQTIAVYALPADAEFAVGD